MLKGRDVLGLPVINLQSGSELGTVSDIIFQPQNGKLEALVVKDNHNAVEKLVLVKDIENIGEDAVMIPDKSVLQNNEQIKEAEERLVKNTGRVVGKKVLTYEGRELGKINDILLDPQRKKFSGFEVSEGLIDDLLKGRSILKSNYHWRIGEDAIIIEKEKEEGR